jgi:hypothetical protein
VPSSNGGILPAPSPPPFAACEFHIDRGEMLVFHGLTRNPDVVFTESATDDQARLWKPNPLPQ